MRLCSDKRAVRWLVSWCAVAGLGCEADSGAEPAQEVQAATTELLPAPAPGHGVQYTMTTEIPAGAEVEHCKFVRAPETGMLVNRDMVRFTSGSHHVLLYETDYDDIPTVKDDGTAVDTSGVFDCSDGPTNGWSITKLIGGSQNGQGESLLAFPDGIAVRVRPRTVMMINAHYINTHSEAVQPEVRINLYTLQERELLAEGDLLFFYNPFIEVPVGQRSRARMRCPVDEEVTITNVQSHMHARGVGYAAMIEGEAPFYVNDRWESVPVQTFEPGLVVRPGQRLDYYCDYENASGVPVYQGLRTSDEMCMLIGSYYPARGAFGQCDLPDGKGPASEWVGAGNAGCAETLACIERGFAAGERALQEVTGCVGRSHPDVAAQMSALLRCMLAGGKSDCAAEAAACRDH